MIIDDYKKIMADVLDVTTHVRQVKGNSGVGEKNFVMCFLIYYFKCKTTLDLGVYGGGSLFPQATMHNKYTDGIVYGVDPYNKEDMVQFDNTDTEFLKLQKDVLNNLDVEELYHYILNLINELSYADNVKFLRMRSDKAINYFVENNVRFDLMFIDGNHDTKNAMSDMVLYIPRLNNNGFLVIDDTPWPSIRPAYDYAKTQLSFVYERHGDGGFAVLQKTDVENIELKEIINKIIK